MLWTKMHKEPTRVGDDDDRSVAVDPKHFLSLPVHSSHNTWLGELQVEKFIISTNAWTMRCELEYRWGCLARDQKCMLHVVGQAHFEFRGWVSVKLIQIFNKNHGVARRIPQWVFVISQ